MRSAFLMRIALFLTSRAFIWLKETSRKPCRHMCKKTPACGSPCCILMRIYIAQPWVALEHLWPLVVPGGVVAFDEYGIPPWEGESRAVDEFFAGKKIRLQRFDWASNPGAFIVKE
jgi:hypothetical protein